MDIDDNFLPHTKYQSGSKDRLSLEKDLQLIWNEWTKIDSLHKENPGYLKAKEPWTHYETYLHRTSVAHNHAASYIRLQEKKALYLLAPVEPLVHLSEFKWPKVPKPRIYREKYSGPLEFVMANRKKFLRVLRRDLPHKDPGLYRTLAREGKLDILFPDANPDCVENGRRGGSTRHSPEIISRIIELHTQTCGNSAAARRQLAEEGIICSCGTILRRWKKNKLRIGKKYQSQQARKMGTSPDVVAAV